MRLTQKIQWLAALAIAWGTVAAGWAQSEFHPGRAWNDISGQPIQAHGGGILSHDNAYYWYGEDRTPGASGGVSCYSSTNLYDWKRESSALPREALPVIDGRQTFLERPKTLFNQPTRKFVMWMHLEQPGYQLARAGVAAAERPAGPFVFLNSFQPNGNMSRDMTLYLDDDGSAYDIYSSRENYDLRICQLTEDFLSATTNDVLIASDHREGPALFKWHGWYYLVTSGCTGWAPNAANYYTTRNILGPWGRHPNPCRGRDADTTFNSQSTFILATAGNAPTLIFMADQWKPRHLGDSAYVWLPIQCHGDALIINWLDAWKLN